MCIFLKYITFYKLSQGHIAIKLKNIKKSYSLFICVVAMFFLRIIGYYMFFQNSLFHRTLEVRTMKKLLSILLALCMCFSLCFSLASCDDDTPTDNNSTQTNNGGNSNSNSNNNNSSSNGNNTIIPASDSFEELEKAIAKDIEQTVNQLNTKWQSLKSDITTYDEYVDNVDKVEDFYGEINDTALKACVRLQKYTVQYADLIMNFDMSNDDKYDAFDDLLDCIYEDAADDIYDGIYEAILDDMLDTFYNGVLDDSDNAPSYSEWIDVCSDEYSNWLDTCSDVYSNWFDACSDIYSFYFDISSELFSDDIERAEKIFHDYKEDVEKLS